METHWIVFAGGFTTYLAYCMLTTICFHNVKDLYSCSIETTKGTVSVSHMIKGASRGDIPVYNTLSFTKIHVHINI